jgi:hypothetical protein
MHDDGHAPGRVSLCVDGESHPAVALELTGHRAAIQSAHALALDERVRLAIDWPSGARTVLPALVRAVAPLGGRDTVAHVDLCGVEGDWRSFLEYLGPLSAAG